MTSADGTVDATTYLQIVPEWTSGPSDNPRSLRGANVIAHTKNRPARQRPGTVLVKLMVRIPKGAFLPLAPEAVVVIPEGMTTTEPIAVEVLDASPEVPGD